MKYQAILTIGFDAEDVYIERDHRQQLTEMLAAFKAAYPTAELAIKTKRQRLRPRAAPPAKMDQGVEIIRARYVA